MDKTYLTIPCQWDIESVKELVAFKSSSGVQISEMYGALSDGATPQGRAVSVAHQCDKKEAIEIKNILDEKKIEFAYLINTPINLNKYKGLEAELDWIINVFRADSITITSLELMKLIRSRYQNVKINVSTIAGVKTIDDVKSYLSVKPNKVIAHHDLNRNFRDLEKLNNFLNKEGIKLEIMLNESCLRRCKFRQEHYMALGEGKGDRIFHKKCNTIKIEHPYQLLMANFIRPEDLTIYKNIGIKFFKITGRSKPLGWLQEVVNSYLEQKYDGNLVRLLGIDPLLSAEQWIFIDNGALNSFLDGFPKNNNVDEEIEYCEKWILELFKTGNFYISEKEIEGKTIGNKLRFKIKKDIYL